MSPVLTEDVTETFEWAEFKPGEHYRLVRITDRPGSRSVLHGGDVVKRDGAWWAIAVQRNGMHDEWTAHATEDDAKSAALGRASVRERTP